MHHVRKLERAFEQDQQAWAEKVQEVLLDIHNPVESTDGVLSPEDAENQRQHYSYDIASFGFQDSGACYIYPSTHRVKSTIQLGM